MVTPTIAKNRTESFDGRIKLDSPCTYNSMSDSYPYMVVGFNKSGKKLAVARLKTRAAKSGENLRSDSLPPHTV